MSDIETGKHFYANASSRSATAPDGARRRGPAGSAHRARCPTSGSATSRAAGLRTSLHRARPRDRRPLLRGGDVGRGKRQRRTPACGSTTTRTTTARTSTTPTATTSRPSVTPPRRPCPRRTRGGCSTTSTSGSARWRRRSGFYGAVLIALGHEVSGAGPLFFDELYFSGDGPATTGLHLAFQAGDRDTVDAFYKAALSSADATTEHPVSASTTPGYYAAYVLDPDGNNVEAVFHGPANARPRRSSSVGKGGPRSRRRSSAPRLDFARGRRHADRRAARDPRPRADARARSGSRRALPRSTSRTSSRGTSSSSTASTASSASSTTRSTAASGPAR